MLISKSNQRIAIFGFAEILDVASQYVCDSLFYYNKSIRDIEPIFQDIKLSSFLNTCRKLDGKQKATAL